MEKVELNVESVRRKIMLLDEDAIREVLLKDGKWYKVESVDNYNESNSAFTFNMDTLEFGFHDRNLAWNKRFDSTGSFDDFDELYFSFTTLESEQEYGGQWIVGKVSDILAYKLGGKRGLEKTTLKWVSPRDPGDENDKKKVSKPVNKYKSKPKDIDMVIKYFKEKDISDAKNNAIKFYNHYEASGWMRGKTKIKNWKMCLSSWDFASDSEILRKPNSYKYECYKCDEKLTLNKDIEPEERYHDGCGGDYLKGQELINRRAEYKHI